PVDDTEAFIICEGAMPPTFTARWGRQGGVPEEWVAFVTNAGGALTRLSSSRIGEIELSCLEEAKRSCTKGADMTQDGIRIYCQADLMGSLSGSFVSIEDDVLARRMKERLVTPESPTNLVGQISQNSRNLKTIPLLPAISWPRTGKATAQKRGNVR